jgi:hypothetical protein
MDSKIQDTYTEFMEYVKKNREGMSEQELMKSDVLLQALVSYLFLIPNDYKNWEGEHQLSRDVIDGERRRRGYGNYHNVELSPDSIGIYKLKRPMSFNRTTGTVGLDKGCVVELAKYKDKYAVRMVNNRYADKPNINPRVQKYITEKQIGYYCINQRLDKIPLDN